MARAISPRVSRARASGGATSRVAPSVSYEPHRAGAPGRGPGQSHAQAVEAHASGFGQERL
eukprot:11937117-Alexandrium_andersonii.AAC.1